MKSPRAKSAVTALALLTLAAAAWSIAHANSEDQVNRARFVADGSAIRPMEWRQWVHIGTRYKPIGLNILDQKLTKTPEILNAYVEPSAMAVYQQTGQWPEGTQIVKELTAVQVGPRGELRRTPTLGRYIARPCETIVLTNERAGAITFSRSNPPVLPRDRSIPLSPQSVAVLNMDKLVVFESRKQLKKLNSHPPPQRAC